MVIPISVKKIQGPTHHNWQRSIIHGWIAANRRHGHRPWDLYKYTV